jgi:hypothetical protein
MKLYLAVFASATLSAHLAAQTAGDDSIARAVQSSIDGGGRNVMRTAEGASLPPSHRSDRSRSWCSAARRTTAKLGATSFSTQQEAESTNVDRSESVTTYG